jgi:hypothetical protein
MSLTESRVRRQVGRNRRELTMVMGRRGRRKGGDTTALNGGERPPVASGGHRRLRGRGECGGGGDLSQGRGMASRRG